MRQRFYGFLIRTQYRPREREPERERKQNHPGPPQSLTRPAEAAPPEHGREMSEHQQQRSRSAPYIHVPQEGDERLRGDHVLDRPMRLERRGVVVLRQHNPRDRKTVLRTMSYSWLWSFRPGMGAMVVAMLCGA